MVKNYDFIIGYENKVRELESAYLLKYELERRGYSVFVFQEFDQRFDDVVDVIYHAKVLILSCGYEDKYVEGFCRKFLTFDKLINWQWEQVYYKKYEDDPDSLVNIHGDVVRQAVHLSWGDFNVKRLTEVAKLPAKNVKKTGIISMDFIKEGFEKFYESREDILSKYDISPDYKVAILLGAYSGAFKSEEELQKFQAETGFDYIAMAKKNRKKFDIEINWIYQALLADENLYFIYRPHPGDEYDRCPKDVQELLDSIKKKTGRFIVNQDYTVKQWLKVVDRVYTAASTTMVDAYFGDVSCRMLSPGDADPGEACVLFDTATGTATYEEFIESLSNDEFVTPLDVNVIDGYYTIGKEVRYPYVADAVIEVLKDDSYLIDTSVIREHMREKSKEALAGKSFAKRLKLKLWKYDWFYNMYWKLISLPIKNSYFIKQRDYKARIDQYKKSYVGSEEEIKNIEMRIRRCVEA